MNDWRNKIHKDNPLLAQVVRCLPSTETTKDQIPSCNFVGRYFSWVCEYLPGKKLLFVESKLPFSMEINKL